MAPSFGLSSSSATSEFYGARSRCSFKTATAFICACNVIVGIYFLRLLSPAYFFSSSSSPSVTLFRSTSNLPSSAKFIEAQTGHIREALNVWRKAEPVDLIKRVQEIRKESPAGVLDDEQLELLRENVTFEIIKIMEELKAAGNVSWKHQKVALEQWRKRNLEDLDTLAEETKGGKTEAQPKAQEAEAIKFLLTVGWSSLLEDAGFDDSPVEEIPSDAELANATIPGKPLPAVCRGESHTDYDGAAVRWGLSFHVESAADCCQACIDQAKSAKPEELKCNIWVYCPEVAGCYSPDIYEHRQKECWLKQASNPRLNFKGKYSPEYRKRHPRAPVVVPWAAGVISLEQ